MALRFKVETLEDKVRFYVKGIELDLSYHAASCLCNTIIEACLERKESKANKRQWWLLRAKQGKRCNIREGNRQDYEDFLKANGIDIDSLRESNLGHTYRGKPHEKEKAKPLSRKEREAQRKAAQQAKIEALKQKYHIPQKDVQP